MAVVRITGGTLNVEPLGSPPEVGGGPIYPPGVWPPPGHPAHPDLPGGPVDPGYGVPLPPVVSHPIPPTPEHPIELPPTYPVDPDYGLPIGPGVWPQPPKPVDPGYGVPIPIAPEFPIYLPPQVNPPLPPGSPAHPIALPPGSVWPPLPPSVTGTVTALVWIVGVGYRWTVIDTSLKPTHPIMPPSRVPVSPDQGLPPSAQPKR
jgi:hypothetical protein